MTEEQLDKIKIFKADFDSANAVFQNLLGQSKDEI